MIFEGVKRGLERRGEIAPYKLDGPIRLNLLDSEGHVPPLKPVLDEAVRGETMSEAFEKAVRSFSWNQFGEQVVDSYRYPTNLAAEK